MRCCRKNRQLALPRLRLHRQEWSSVRLPRVLPPASSLVQSTSVCVYGVLAYPLACSPSSQPRTPGHARCTCLGDGICICCKYVVCPTHPKQSLNLESTRVPACPGKVSVFTWVCS